MDFYPQPAAGAARPWAFPAPERATLASGLTVLRCHRPGQQVVAVEVCLSTPLDAEPEGLDGIAAIMADALSEGTSEHTAEEFAAELERCGATLDSHADYLGGRLSLEVPVSRLPRAVGLLAEALRGRLRRQRGRAAGPQPAGPDPAGERQPRPARGQAAVARAVPGESARMSRPRQGTEETVRRIDAAGVRAFYQAHVRPATATAVVVGDLAGLDLDAVLADTLGAWTGDSAGPLPAIQTPADDTGRVVIVDRPGSVQTQLLIGRTGPDRHDAVWPALVIGTYCLGGTLTSRLDRVLREEKGYTYGVRASQQVLQSPDPARAPGSSLLAISGSVDTESTGPALGDLWTVLRTLAAGGLTGAERDVAVQNLVGVAPLRFETAASVAGTMADQVQQHLADDYQGQLYARLAQTGTDAATAAVVAAFPENRLVTILVGDAGQIQAPVEALGIGPVTVVPG